jgi:hypothetical protein
MWANVAITSHMSRDRLEKFGKKITAFYGREMGVDLSAAEFVIKAKHVEVPTTWEYDLRHRNMAEAWRDIGSLHWGPEGARLTLRDLPSGDGHSRHDRKPGAPLQ